MAKRRTQEEIITDKILKSEEKVHKLKVNLEQEQKVLRKLNEELKNLEMKELLKEIENNNISTVELKEFINQKKSQTEKNEQHTPQNY